MPGIKIVSSEIEVTLKVISGKQKPLVLYYLQYGGVERYNEILHYLGTVPEKTLIAQLRELEEDGIIDRTVIPTLPVQIEYSIAEHGKTLFPILGLMCDWGYRNMGDRYQLTHPTYGCEDEE